MSKRNTLLMGHEKISQTRTREINLFHLYFYPPDLEESVGGATHRRSNYPDLLHDMPRYCCPVEIFNLDFYF